MPTEPTGRKRGRPRDPNAEPRRRKTLEFVESVAAQLEAQADAAGLSDSLYVARLVQRDAKGGAK